MCRLLAEGRWGTRTWCPMEGLRSPTRRPVRVGTVRAVLLDAKAQSLGRHCSGLFGLEATFTSAGSKAHLTSRIMVSGSRLPFSTMLCACTSQQGCQATRKVVHRLAHLKLTALNTAAAGPP